MVRTIALCSLSLLTACYAGRDGANADGETDGADDAPTAGAEDGGDDDGADDDGNAEAAPFPGGLRRLSRAQIANAYRSVLRAPDLDLGDALPVDPSTDEDFRFDTELVAFAPFGAADVDKLDRAALAAAAEAFADADLLTCAPAAADDDCAAGFLRDMLRRAFRRPATDDEVAAYTELAVSTATSLDDVQIGLEFATATALQSPWLLYQVEPTDPDGGTRTLDSYELASRLAFFVWNEPPDEELAKLADEGTLTDDDVLRAQVQRMLADPRAAANMQGFFRQWFGYGSIELLPKNSGVFPQFGPPLANAMRIELDHAIDQIVGGEDYRSLFTSDQTWATPLLADFYGIEHPGGTGVGAQLDHWEAEEAGAGCNAEGLPAGFHNLCSDTAVLSRTVDVPKGADAHRISIRAYATQGGDELANMRVSVDGAVVLETDVEAEADAPQVYTVDTPLAAGAREITVQLTNDYYVPPENRDLVIDWIEVDELTPGGTEPVALTLPPERRGLLTRAGILATYAKPIDTSPTTRGLFVRQRLLCDEVPAPPPGVATDLPPIGGDVKTNRERVAQHMQDPVCAGCHQFIDPLGLPLEHFDGIGEYRETHDGAALDVTGALDGVTFDGAIEMGQTVAADPRAMQCAVKQLARFAFGQEEGEHQEAALVELATVLDDSGSWPTFIEAFVLSDFFRTVGPETAQ
mgnify:CR=1 FL=1